MTPAQVARKRARDRLFQQTTRARTQEYIQRLEQELQELRVTTAPETFGLDRKALQELYSQNQRLQDELARLQCLDANEQNLAIAKIESVVPDTRQQSASFGPLFENKMQALPPAYSSLCGYHIESSAPSANVQLSASSTVSAAQPPQSYHIPTEYPPESLAPDLWHGNPLASFDLPVSDLTSQPAQATLSYSHDVNVRESQPVLCQRNF